MQSFVLLLRGINVGGHNKLAMKDLKQAMQSAGFVAVETYIQSGNVIADYTSSDPRQVAQALQALIKATFGYDVDVMALTGEELKTIAAACPYPTDDGKQVHIWFSDSEPQFDSTSLEAVLADGEACCLKGRVLYFYAPKGIGRSKAAAKIPAALNISSTARNFNTVNKLLQMLAKR